MTKRREAPQAPTIAQAPGRATVADRREYANATTLVRDVVLAGGRLRLTAKEMFQ